MLAFLWPIFVTIIAALAGFEVHAALTWAAPL